MDALHRTARRAAVLSLAAFTLAASGESLLEAEPSPNVPRNLEIVTPDASFQIIGRVTDAATGRSIPGARVTIAATGQEARTNADGRYTISLPEGTPANETLEISVSLPGYRSASIAVHPAARMQNGFLTVDFRLEAAVVDRDEPTVAGDVAQEARSVPMSVVPLAAPYASGAALRNPLPGFDREQYARIEDNAFKSVLDHPLSTFSIDVDRASYSNVRRFLLGEHRLPPLDAVQVEEMVNYFPYDYTLPRDGEPLGITTELGRAPWRPEHRLLRIGLASPAIEVDDLPPSNLVFLLDVSGSMHSPDKLPLVKRSLRLLVDQMREEDRVALVVYAGAAGLVLEPTSGAHKERILEAIGRLEAGGSTAGGAGLRLAYDVARRHFAQGGNNRVILATDGDFNVGESSDAAMTRLVEDRREDGTFLTILGFGTGNLQNTKMQEMAQNGNGNYAYIDGLDEARKVLVGEMGGTLLAVAKDVKIQVEFNPERVRSYRLIGYENRLLAAEDFNDDRKDAGELGAGHTVTALYEIVPVGSDSDVDTPPVDPLRYQDAGRVGGGRGGDELAFVKVRYKEPDGTESRLLTRAVEDRDARRTSVDFRFASAVAGFGMLLRNSEHRGDMTADEILHLAESATGSDVDGYRRGFLELVEAYRSITGSTDTDTDRPHE